MIRLLILIFALNTFAVPATAMVACNTMYGSSAEMMSTSNEMVKMNCNMSDAKGMTCNSSQCVSNCAATVTPLLISNKPLLLNITDHTQYQAGSIYYYTITLPVSTPPPLS